MKWITRKNIKVDRVACPWLIWRFVDPEAEFLFVNEAELLQGSLICVDYFRIARQPGATRSL